MQSTPAVTRRRPKLQTTVADETYRSLDQLRRDTGLPTLGVAIDYLVKDRERLARLLHTSSLATTEAYEAAVASQAA